MSKTEMIEATIQKPETTDPAADTAVEALAKPGTDFLSADSLDNVELELPPPDSAAKSPRR